MDPFSVDGDSLTTLTFFHRWCVPLRRSLGGMIFHQTRFITAFDAYSFEWTVNLVGPTRSPESSSSWYLDLGRIFAHPTPKKLLFKLQITTENESSPLLSSVPAINRSSYFSDASYRIFEGDPLLDFLISAFDDDSRWHEGRALLTIEFRFAANDFKYEPIKSVPVHSLLKKGDFRKRLKDIYRCIKPDFKFSAIGGEVLSHKSLLFISSPYFRDLLTDENASLNTMSINCSKEAVNQTVSYMIYGAFESPELMRTNLIPQMSVCAKRFQLRLTQFHDDVGRVLMYQLMQNGGNLEEVVNILVLSHSQQEYPEVKRMCIALIVERHYERFREEYNSNATGEKRRIYDRLSQSAIPSLSPISRILNIHRDSQLCQRILHYRCSNQFAVE